MFQSAALVCFSFVIRTHCPRQACPKAFIGVYSFDVFIFSGDVCNVQNLAGIRPAFIYRETVWQKAHFAESHESVVPAPAARRS